MPKKNVEKILNDDGNVLAIIGNTKKMKGKANFITPNDFSFQTAVQNADKKSYWEAHKHQPFKSINYLEAQEFIYVTKGELNIGIYSGAERVTERKLEKGYFIILNSGHDIKSLKKTTQFIAIKQGPYRGKEEKVFLE